MTLKTKSKTQIPRDWLDAFEAFCQTVAALRDPDHGCPWDLQQSHSTLQRYMIEEAYEAAECMQDDAGDDLASELGDVLLQVVLNAQIARDEGRFDLATVIRSIDSKMRRRHPHVFGGIEVSGIDEVKQNWAEIKAAERAMKEQESLRDSSHQSARGQSEIFADTKGVFPSTRQAYEIGKRAQKIGFDWPDEQGVWQQLISEVEELRQAIDERSNDGGDSHIAEELGDVYFTLAQLSRHLGFHPEQIGFQANRKFLNRFSLVEGLAQKKGCRIEEMGTNALEELWKEAKRIEKKGSRSEP